MFIYVYICIYVYIINPRIYLGQQTNFAIVNGGPTLQCCANLKNFVNFNWIPSCVLWGLNQREKR